VCAVHILCNMKGRKPAIPPDVVVEAVLRFKDRVVITDNGENSKSKISFYIIYFTILVHTV